MIKSINMLTNTKGVPSASRGEFMDAGFACIDFMLTELESRGEIFDGWDEFLFRYQEMKEFAIPALRANHKRMDAYNTLFGEIPDGRMKNIFDRIVKISFSRDKDGLYLYFNFMLHAIVERLEPKTSSPRIRETEFKLVQIAAQHFGVE